MKILYQLPSADTIYAGRTIYHGYKNAFIDLGYEFYTMTADDDSRQVLETFQPDIFITSLSPYYLKFLDIDAVLARKKVGMRVFVNTPFWNSPLSNLRVNETPSLSSNKEHIRLIRSGFGDVYYNVCEQDSVLMDGFEEATGYKFQTLALAADKISLKPIFDEHFHADVSFIGTYLPEKRHFFDQYVIPLGKRYNLKLYGQDWTIGDRMLGWAQRGGQYFNIPPLSSIRKPKLKLEDEAKIYASSTVSINVHEDFQKRIGTDCNERTFKIPFSGGFEITDDVACIRKYFKEDEEIVIAKNQDDWFDKIEFFIRNPEKRIPIIVAGKKRVLAEHTYHHRVTEMLRWYREPA
ncbi:MAG: glycosyltransferase [Thiobacillus sp.]|nr:glycosyltransferase [Thiobacillus sp.]